MPAWRDGSTGGRSGSDLEALLSPVTNDGVGQRPYANDHGIAVAGSAIGANGIRGVRYTIEHTGTLLGFAVFLTASSGNHVAGVYSPTVTNLSLLATTGVVVASGANTWADFTFTSSITVTAGQSTFFCVHPDNATVAYGRSGSPANNAAGGPLPSGIITDPDGSNLLCWNYLRGSFSAPMPSTIPVASLAASGGVFSFYCKYA